MANAKGLMVAGALAGIAALGWIWVADAADVDGDPITPAANASVDASESGHSASRSAEDSAVDRGEPGAHASTRTHRAARRTPPRLPSTAQREPATPPSTDLAPIPSTVSPRDCATAGHQHPDCDFVEPDPEVLEEMATCGIVRYDFPAMFAQRDWTPEFEAQWLDLVGATGEEREQLMDLADEYRDELFGSLEVIGQEVGVPPFESDATLLDVVVALSEAVGDGNVTAASRRVAQERAGLADAPESMEGLPAAERFLRTFSSVGTSFEDKLASGLGDARAHELRLAQDGWPGLKYQTGARCPD